jgi:hypothetical protein
MTIKLAILKSGEDIIADMQEMVIGQEEEQKVIGYFFNKPCVVKLINQDNIVGENGNKAFEINMFPWNPLSKDTRIPVSVDWVVTLVEPIEKLKKMYETNVLGYGEKDDQSNDVNEQSSSNQSD